MKTEKKHILKACASCGCSEGIGEEQELDEVWPHIAKKIAPAIWGGAKKYAEMSKLNNETHIGGIESDAGGHTPRGFSIDEKTG